MYKKWNDIDIHSAIELNQKGKRFDEIGLILNRTKRSVKEKLCKLDLRENKIITTEKTYCYNCGNEIIDFKKNKRKFCSRNCSAIYNNKIYPKRKNNEKLSNCINCKKELNYYQFKYCSKFCESEYKEKIVFQKIENGDITLDSRYYKRYLIKKYGEKCMKCGWHETNSTSGFIPIQLEHKDGNSENHNLNNLELLCPNHHSLTPTFGILNKGNGRKRRRFLRQKNK